jgi:glycosyltransferase involved in cell wall biosynthesis
VRRTTGSLDYVGASSEAWAAELANLGLDEMQVKRARWGVRPRDVNPKGPSVPRRLLWTGFIPLVGPNEFLLALRTAKEVLDVDPDVSFRFNFKPESWRNEFHGLSQPRIDIGVSQRPFAEQLLEADALFSPMAPGAILTPALSWLEAMAYEVPVVTSNVLGVEELIEDNWSGFVQRDGEELRHTVLRALESDFRRTGKNARYAVEEGFNLDQSINDLIALWEGA